MKNVLKVIVFLILLIVSIYIAGDVLTPRWVTYDIIPEYKNVPKDTLDVLFIGDSNVYSDISPMEIFETYGITSYNYSSPAASNLLMYYMLKEALKTQTPKVVVMNGTTIFGDKESNEMRQQTTDVMPLDDVKLELLSDSIYNFSLGKKLAMIVPFFNYHDRWNHVKINEINKSSNKTYNKGYVFQTEEKKTKAKSDYMAKDDGTANFRTDFLPESVLKAKELCDEKGIKFLFISTPDTTAWNYDKYEKLSSWTQENNIDYLDLNINSDEIGINFDTDSVNNGMHLNIKGAIKVSNYLGQYLSNNYGLTNHLNDSKYNYWSKDIDKYNEVRDSYLSKLEG